MTSGKLSPPATSGAEGSPARFRKHGLRAAELWLDQPVTPPKECDLLLLQQYTKVPAGAFSSPFVSVVLDLSQSSEELLQGLNRDTKYKIRRAEGKDQAICIVEAGADDELCRQFLAFYDEFAVAKGVGRLSEEELLARARAGALRFSRAIYGDQTVVWHVHVATTEKATLLYSASHFRQVDDNDMRAAIGRANRLLHWKDISQFKADGLKIYDFGGWYAGTEDQSLLKINRFKEGFGGTRVNQVNAALALTWRGWVYLMLRNSLSARQRKLLQLKLHSLVRR